MLSSSATRFGLSAVADATAPSAARVSRAGASSPEGVRVEETDDEFKASDSCKIRCALRDPGACQVANSGARIRFQLQLQQDDGVLDLELALFQALYLEVVDAGLVRHPVDQAIKPTVLRFQLQNAVAKCIRIDDVMMIAHARLLSRSGEGCLVQPLRLRLLSGLKRVTGSV